MPVAFVAIGIAIMTGAMLPQLPEGTMLRPVMGIVVMLIGIHRFVVSRVRAAPRERPFGGDRPRPWDTR